MHEHFAHVSYKYLLDSFISLEDAVHLNTGETWVNGNSNRSKNLAKFYFVCHQMYLSDINCITCNAKNTKYNHQLISLPYGTWKIQCSSFILHIFFFNMPHCIWTVLDVHVHTCECKPKFISRMIKAFLFHIQVGIHTQIHVLV